MRFCFVVLLTLTIVGEFVSPQLVFKKGAPHVKSNDRFLVGIVKQSREAKNYYAFYGIKYGEIKERFQPAEAFLGTGTSNSKAEHVIKPGARCPQSFGEDVEGDEDCLFLNVFVPMKSSLDADGYPVMVWIHGGAFQFGSGDSYQPDYFMDEDVILITINYRLGIFGFLNTEDDTVEGNMGLKDQVLALKWVKENIKYFGGDPKRVTVFGNSAGAASVHYLMLSPTSRGLFQSAVAQSGSAHCPWALRDNPLEDAKEIGKLLNCSVDSSVEILQCLKSKSVNEILSAQSKMKRWFIDPMVPFGPTIENLSQKSKAFLYEHPQDIIQQGQLMKVPLMAGVMADEGLSLHAVGIKNNEKLMLQLDSDFATIAPITLNIKSKFPTELLPNVTDAIRTFYFNKKSIKDSDSFKNLTNLYSDANFVHGVWKLVINHAPEMPVYPYVLSFENDCSSSMTKLFIQDDTNYGVAHGDELQYLFKVPFLSPPPKDSVCEKFSKELVKLWASFARHRKPVEIFGSQKFWYPVSRAQLYGEKPFEWYDLGVDTSIILEPFVKRTNFWDKLYKKYTLTRPKDSSRKDEL